LDIAALHAFRSALGGNALDNNFDETLALWVTSSDMLGQRRFQSGAGDPRTLIYGLFRLLFVHIAPR
jgi:hypothetical protein